MIFTTYVILKTFVEERGVITVCYYCRKMEKTFKKLDSIIRGGLSPITSSSLDGISYHFTASEMKSYDEEIRDKKKFDDDDELCNCPDPCDEINQAS